MASAYCGANRPTGSLADLHIVTFPLNRERPDAVSAELCGG